MVLVCFTQLLSLDVLHDQKTGVHALDEVHGSCVFSKQARLRGLRSCEALLRGSRERGLTAQDSQPLYIFIL